MPVRLQWLSVKEAEAEATRRGWKVETNQNGIQRIEVGDAVVTSGSTYASIELSVPVPPEKVTKFRLVAVTPWGTEAVLGDFESSYEATNKAIDFGLEEGCRRIDEVQVPEVAS